MPKSKQPKRQELGSDELRALFSSLGLSAQTTERAVQMRCKPPAEGADDASRHGSRSVRRERAIWKHCFQFQDRRQIPPMFGGKTSATSLAAPSRRAARFQILARRRSELRRRIKGIAAPDRAFLEAIVEPALTLLRAAVSE